MWLRPHLYTRPGSKAKLHSYSAVGPSFYIAFNKKEISIMDAFKQRGDNAFRAGNFDEAISCYGEALRHSPKEPEKLRSNRCACYIKKGTAYLSNALTDAQECVRIKPSWPKGHSRLGSVLLRQGKVVEARRAYERVLSLDPDNSEARSAIESMTLSGSSSSSSSSSSSFPGMGAMPGMAGLNMGNLWQRAKDWGIQALSRFSLGNLDTTSVLVGIIALLLSYIFFFSGGGSTYYGGGGYGYDSSYGFGGGGSTGMSWTTWALVLYGAWKLPPMFPDQLGHYAQPFFGMNWTTFLWLLSFINNNFLRGGRGGGMGGGGFPGGFGGFGGRRRGFM